MRKLIRIKCCPGEVEKGEGVQECDATKMRNEPKPGNKYLLNRSEAIQPNM